MSVRRDIQSAPVGAVSLQRGKDILAQNLARVRRFDGCWSLDHRRRYSISKRSSGSARKRDVALPMDQRSRSSPTVRSTASTAMSFMDRVGLVTTAV